MKKIFILILPLLLSACAFGGDAKPDSKVQVIATQSYPNLPDVQPVPPVNLQTWTNDMPRDTTKTTIKNTTDCMSVPKDKQDNVFWIKCGEHPIIPNSNIFIGFDLKNWTIVQENFLKLKEQLAKYQARIDDVNKQRADWRKLNQEEQARLNAAKQPNQQPTQ